MEENCDEANKRDCAICRQEIEVHQETIGHNENKKTIKGLFSDEGIYFEEGNVWFCLSCYKQITENIKVTYKDFL